MSTSPASISGLLAWFDASVGTTLSTSATASPPALAAPADGASIGSWFDNSGNNTSTFSQSTAAQQPTYKASGTGLPGHPCLEFSNANTPVNGSGPLLVERTAVLYTPLGSSNSILMLVYRSGQSGPPYEVLFTNNEGGSGAEFLLDYGGFTRYNCGVSVPLTTNAMSALTYTYNTTGNVEKLFVNNPASPGGTASSGRPSMGANPFQIGSAVDALNGEVYELLVYNRELSNTEIAEVYSYWNTKYGTTFSTSAGPLTASTISASNITKTGAQLAASSALGGTSPYTYQWYRSMTSGSASAIAIAGNAISGASGLSYTDSGLSVQTTYSYVFATTDTAGTTVLSNVLTMTTHGATTVGIIAIGDSITYGADVVNGTSDPITVMAQTLQASYPAYDFQVQNLGTSGQLFRVYSPLTYSSDTNYNGSDYVGGLISDCNNASPPVKFVVLMEGTNDWSYGPYGNYYNGTNGSSLNPTNYKADLQAVASALAAAGITLIINQLIYRETGNADDSTNGLPAWNSEIAALPFSSTLKQGDTTMYAYFKANPSQLQDGLHPNVQGSAALGQAWATAIGPMVTSNVVDPSSAGILYSPFNWHVQAGSAQTINSGAYLRTLFTGTSVALSFNTANNASPFTELIARVDNGAWSTLTLASGNPTLQVASGLDNHVHLLEVMVKSSSQSLTRWAANAQTMVTLTGIVLDPGATVAAPQRRSKNLLLFGDGTAEGVLAGVTSSSSDTNRNDVRASFSYEALSHLDCEFGIVAFAGAGMLTGGSGSVPAVPQSYNLLFAGAARSFSSPAPDLVIYSLGVSDTGASSNSASFLAGFSTVTQTILAASPSSRHLLLAPFTGSNGTLVQEAANATANPRVGFVDTTGWWNTAQSPDGTDPYGAAQLGFLAPKLLPLLSAALYPLDRRYSFA